MAKMEKTRHPGIYKRGGRYVIVWRHRGKQHKESFRTLAEARDAKGKRQAGERRPTSKIGFEEYFTEWIESYSGRTKRGFSDASRDIYRGAIATHALPDWRTWRLDDIGPKDVRDLYARLRGEGAATTQLRKIRAALSALFATAVEDELLPRNPVRGVRIPNADIDEKAEEKAKALTRSELATLLAAMPEGWRLFFEFLAVTGLRISEAVGLRWEDIDLGGAPKVKVREQLHNGRRKRLKSEAGRRDVPLSPRMVEKLLAHRRDSYEGAKSPVFATPTGTPLNPQNVRQRVLRPVALGLGHYEEVEAGDGRMRKRTTIGFHTLRHTCASMLFAEGRNLKQVQRWLGHADPKITLSVYVHLLDEGVGAPLDLEAESGNGVATQALQTAANPTEDESLKTAN
jgi:integrase